MNDYFTFSKTKQSKAEPLVIYEHSPRLFPLAGVFQPLLPCSLLRLQSHLIRGENVFKRFFFSLSLFFLLNSTRPPSLQPLARLTVSLLWSRLAASADRPVGTWALYVQEMSSGGGRRPPSAPRPLQVLDTHPATPHRHTRTHTIWHLQPTGTFAVFLAPTLSLPSISVFFSQINWERSMA